MGPTTMSLRPSRPSPNCPPLSSTLRIEDTHGFDTLAVCHALIHPIAPEAAAPEQKQSMSEQAAAEAVQAIQSHGLSVQEYSNVIRVAQNDPLVKQKLLDAAKSQP
jgi:hypothetical protein